MKTIIKIYNLPGEIIDYEIDTKTTTIDEALKIANLEVGLKQEIRISVVNKVI